MKLTPIDITHRSFNKKMFGLDESEVNDFLQQAALAFEELILERNSLRESMREKELQVQDYKERDQVLKTTIATASQMAERMRHDGEREAKLIIADAQQKAETIMRDSRDSLRKMYQEITDLKRVRIQFEANLKALAQAHLTLVEQGEKYMPMIGLPNVQIEMPDAGTQIPAAAPAATAQAPSTATARRTTSISPLSAG